jgi:hypothetical protein
VDTDSVLCNRAGLARLRMHYGDRFGLALSIKGTYSSLEVLGPRAYFRDRQRVCAGIPRKAAEQPDGSYATERWSSLATDLADGHAGAVTLSPGTWRVRRNDPRRADSAGADGRTVAYVVGLTSSANGSSAADVTSGS